MEEGGGFQSFVHELTFVLPCPLAFKQESSFWNVESMNLLQVAAHAL